MGVSHLCWHRPRWIARGRANVLQHPTAAVATRAEEQDAAAAALAAVVATRNAKGSIPGSIAGHEGDQLTDHFQISRYRPQRLVKIVTNDN